MTCAACHITSNWRVFFFFKLYNWHQTIILLISFLWVRNSRRLYRGGSSSASSKWMQSDRDWSRYTVELGKEGYRAARVLGIFLTSCSLRAFLHHLSTCTDLGFLHHSSLRGSWTAYMATEVFKHEYSSEQGRKLYHFFLPTLGVYTVSFPPHSIGYKLPLRFDGKIEWYCRWACRIGDNIVITFGL